MPASTLRAPDARRWRIARARAPVALLAAPPGPPDAEGIVDLDLLVEDGRIVATGPAGSLDAPELPTLDIDRGLVLPCFADIHTHLDKGHIWPRKPNPDGTFASALDKTRQDRDARWSAEDLRRRMDFALRCAFAHGTTALRTHLDSMGGQAAISWPVFAALREAWRGRIELQAVSLFPIELALDDALFAEVVGAVVRHGGVLGAVTYMGPALEPGLERLFRAAAEHGLDLDFHVDETHDPQARSLSAIAEAALRIRPSGKILAGHCCSLACQPADEADRVMDRVAEAGLGVVSLPMCNLYLQHRRAGRTPRWRGVTLVHELAARGVPVMLASDNTRDPFYAYGDLDPVEVLREGVRILHLDHPFGDWPRTVTATPAGWMGGGGTLATGGPCDLVLFRARTLNELLARPQADRLVLRAGRPIAAAPPDYRELDDLMGPTP